MRKTSYVSKRISDSFLGLALVAVPLTLPQPATEDVSIENSSVVDAYVRPAKPTALGLFLQSEIESRIEPISGKTFTNSERAQRASAIATAVAEASYIYEVDPFLLISMIEVESRYEVAAVGLHGEIGLMQIKPSTAKWIASITDELYACDLHEIRCNIMTGANYVSHLQEKVEKRAVTDESLEVGTPYLFRQHVLRSYNLGPAKANRLAANRLPANETTVLPYATKISRKADRMRSRYLVLAMNQ